MSRYRKICRDHATRTGRDYQPVQWVEFPALGFQLAGQIESMYSPGYCLSIDGPWDGAAVGLTACQGFGSTGDRELWTHQANGQVTSAVRPCLAI